MAAKEIVSNHMNIVNNFAFCFRSIVHSHEGSWGVVDSSRARRLLSASGRQKTSQLPEEAAAQALEPLSTALPDQCHRAYEVTAAAPMDRVSVLRGSLTVTVYQCHTKAAQGTILYLRRLLHGFETSIST